MKILRNVGVVVDNIETWYESQIFSGIKKMAREKNINLFVFCGMQLESRNKDEAENNVIYDIINTDKLNGLIMLTGNLFNYAHKEEKETFLKKFENIPRVSISVPIDNIPSIVFDNSNATEMILEHLINKHNYRKIAYISGPLLNRGAEIRYETFVRVMKKHNIPIDPDYIYEGDYLEESGKEAAVYFLLQKKIMPQVIAAASDEMAIGALLKLQEMGIKVPNQIAVTGFDNVEKSKIFTPPITTVSQSVYQMGCLSVKLMDEILDGKQVMLITEIGGELVVRESCGCFKIMSGVKYKGYHKNEVDETVFDNGLENLRQALIKYKDILKSKDFKKINISEDDMEELYDQIGRLFSYFLNDIENKVLKGEFLPYLNSCVNDCIVRKTVDIDIPWNKLLFNIGELASENIKDGSLLMLSKNILNLSNVLVNNIYHRKDMLNKYYLEKVYIKSRLIIKEFTSVYSLIDLKEAVKKAMEYFKIENYYLCLYDKPVKHSHVSKFQIPAGVKLILGKNEGQLLKEVSFNSNDLLPQGIIEKNIREDFLFYPLLSENEHFGYIVFSTDVIDNHIYETLREQISLALRNQMLYEERKRAEEKLSLAIKQLEKYNEKLHILSDHDELTMLYNRRGFYKHGEIEFKLAESNKGKFTLFYADLDDLKDINDVFGHQAGDDAIKAASECIKKSLRNDDIIARIGGDEYAMIVHDAFENLEINKILKRIKTNFESYNLNSNKPYKLSISVGYSIFIPDRGISFEDVIQRADSKLYKEKKSKRQLLQ